MVGRPPKPKVKIKDLLSYLDSNKLLTPDKMIHIRRYVEELVYLEFIMKQLKDDIEENKIIEIYENGAQKTRRTNPAYSAYLETLKTYNQLLRQIRGMVDGVEVVW